MRVLYTEDEEIRQLLMDKKDRTILSLLCYNVRLALQKIAQTTGLSRQSVDYRIKVMEKNHLLAGYKTVININKLGYYSYHFFVTVNAEATEKTIIERCIKNPHVNALIKYSGKWNLEISIMAKDPASCQTIFNDLIANLDISSYSVCIILSTIKSSVLPLYVEEMQQPIKNLRNDASFAKQFHAKPIDYQPDETDIKIMYHLADNARSRLTTIGAEVNLTNDAIAYRIKKLIRSKFILQFRPAINYSLLKLSIQTILIKVSRRTKKEDKEFSLFLKGHPNVLWATELMGGWDYMIYVIGENPDTIHHFIDQAKKKFDIYIYSYEIMFAYNEYKYSFMAESITI